MKIVVFCVLLPDNSEQVGLTVDMIRPARELGVEFAFPTQTLYMRSESWSTPEALAAEDYPGGSRRLHDQARQAAHRLTCTGESD